jgi:rare lipoprotein A (peptidoglycan hydrolase)
MIFDERQLTAASMILPLATRARVTNLQTAVRSIFSSTIADLMPATA